MNEIVERLIAAAQQLELDGLDMSPNLDGELHLALLGLVEAVYRWREAESLRRELEREGVAAGSVVDAAVPPSPDGMFAERTELLIEHAYRVNILSIGPVALRMSPRQTDLFEELHEAVNQHWSMDQRAQLWLERGERVHLLPAAPADSEPTDPGPGSPTPSPTPDPTLTKRWTPHDRSPSVGSDHDDPPQPEAWEPAIGAEVNEAVEHDTVRAGAVADGGSAGVRRAAAPVRSSPNSVPSGHDNAETVDYVDLGEPASSPGAVIAQEESAKGLTAGQGITGGIDVHWAPTADGEPTGEEVPQDLLSSRPIPPTAHVTDNAYEWRGPRPQPHPHP